MLFICPIIFISICIFPCVHTNSENHTPIIRLSVNEESPLHTTIGNISRYLLPQPTIITDSLFFNVTQTGLIQLINRLDLEALCTEPFMCCESDKPCILTSNILIESQQEARRMQPLELHVQVVDINDNVPQFPTHSTGGSRQVLEISEMTKVGSAFDLHRAVDRDLSELNQIQRYILRGTELQRTFELDYSKPPNVRLCLIQPLDYEKVKSYVGILEACDPQSCGQQNLTVNVQDANDNSPVFLKSHYTVRVAENLSVGHTVVQLEAEDKDSPAYAIMQFNFHGKVDQGIKDTFRLEPESGRIILRTHLAAHLRSEYKFTVSVKEPAMPIDQSPAVATVTITVEDLNDFSPSIKMLRPTEGQQLMVQENSKPNSRVGVFQITDKDIGNNGKVTCELIPHSSSTTSNQMDGFVLTATGKLYTLSTTRMFDAEQESQITVTLVCTDFGSPPRSTSRDLVVQIQDVNEYRPELERTTYHAAVNENAEAGVEVARIIAHDKDQSAQLSYSLSAQGRQYFDVNSRTGAIETLGNVGSDEKDENRRLLTVLDREKTERITFIVCVSDGLTPSGCGEDRTSTAKTSTIGSLEAHPAFTVSATVYVTVIDQNDNRPKFIEKGPFSVLENEPRGTSIGGPLMAIDRDEGANGHVRYSLRRAWNSVDDKPAPDLFRVDVNGQIDTLEALDREVTNAYTLELVACDSATQAPLCTSINSTVTVLDMNDNTPTWRYPHESDNEVNITADLPRGHIIARVHATDRDADENGRITYTLIDPHRRTVFQVDNTTGDISVALRSDRLVAGGKVDDQHPLLPGIYRLRLRASDQGQPSHSTETWLQVNVFGSETVVSASLNFMIIVVMVAVTGLISICLVIAIVCVRRRSMQLRSDLNSVNMRRSNGYRLGRDAGDGAEGVDFALKHEYGFPIDGATGYVMGVSPTPSDLDMLKLGSHSVGGLPFLGAAANHNGGVDPHHVLGWAGGNPSVAICYPPGYSEPIFANTDTGPPATVRMQVYTPMHTIGPDCGSLFQIPSHKSSKGDENDNSSNCLRLISPSPENGQINTMRSFTDSFSRNNDSDPNLTGTNGMVKRDLYPSSLSQSGHGESHIPNARYAFMPNAPGTLSSTNPVPYCSNGRRVCGLGQPYELDVESADSGRGASEDDPNLFLSLNQQQPHQLLHFYPAFHLTHQPSTATGPTFTTNPMGLMEASGPIQLDLKQQENSSTSDTVVNGGWEYHEQRQVQC